MADRTSLGSWLRSRPWLPRATLVSVGVYTLSQLNIARILGETAYDVLGMQLTWYFGRVDWLLSTWDATDHARYAAHLPWDTVHPLLYSVALTLGLALAFRSAELSPRFDRLLWLPLVAGALDLVENVAFTQVIAAWPELPVTTLRIGMAAATGKWAIVSLLLMLLAGLVASLYGPGIPFPGPDGSPEDRSDPGL